MNRAGADDNPNKKIIFISQLRLKMDKHYIVATIRPWNIAHYHAAKDSLPGTWHLITEKEGLTLERLSAINPRYIFFPHWSDKVPDEIVRMYDCVCFHETDVPFGRGGSPIQNLIALGHEKTVVTALKMVKDFDAGPVYAKRGLSLQGLAEEIFIRSSVLVFDMIANIVRDEPAPLPQEGEVTIFKRRTPEQSRITTGLADLSKLFDHIRMLDAQDYPKAFLQLDGLRFEFSRPALRTDRIVATVDILIRPDEET